MTTPAAALCVACNYPLNGIDSRNCPECGLAFDPSNPSTINLGRPLGRWGRALIKPVGWPMMLVAVAAIVGLGWVTRWPGFWAGFWFGDAYEAMRIPLATTRIEDFRALNPTDRLFVAAVMVWWLAIFWFVLREGTRLLVLAVKRPGKLLRPLVWRRRILAAVLLAVGLFVIGFGWPYRMAVRDVATYEAYVKGPGTGLMPGPPLWPHLQKEAREEKQRQMVHAEVAVLPSPRLRLVGLMNLIHSNCECALPILIERAARETDPEIRIAEIHLIGLYRDSATADALTKHLDAADPATRAAAADALGVLFAPVYRIPNGDAAWWSGGELKTSPAIEIRNIITLVNKRAPELAANQNPPLLPQPIPMPGAVRERLSALMLSGSTLEEREAAARAMLGQTPANYTLRYAEWGVWLATDNDPYLHMADIAAEIPPFVHRTGNSIASLRDHVFEKPIIINKPVIHLRASQPMVVDLETQIRLGRPWFAYPRPDDFSAGVESRVVGFGDSGIDLMQRPMEKQMATLDKSDLAALPDAREGYPWLHPAHRQRDTPGGNAYNMINVINALGVRWQSVIVSPQKLSWMQPAIVPSDPKFKWWTRLRDVDCSWVSSRGESERFLYYDGPTAAQTICEVYIDPQKQLRFSPNAAMPLDGILIQVKDKEATATTLKISPSFLRWDFEKLKSNLKPDARRQLAEMLLEKGLKSTEAEGLLDCWAPQFFTTPGMRFIVVFGTAEYDKVCPMELRPAAKDRVRVGLQLKEFRQ
jgi:hypothetical protein